MSFFLVGGGYDGGPGEVDEGGLGEAYDAFVDEARPFGPSARIAVVVSGPPRVSAGHADQLSRIVTSRWPQAQILTIHLTGPGSCPPAGQPSDPDGPASDPDGTASEPLWEEDPDFALPEGLDQLAGIIVGGGWVPGYLAGLGPAADQLSRLVRGGAPWLGFSAGAMITAVTALQGGWQLQGRQIAPPCLAEGFEELSLAEGLGLVSLTSLAHNDTCSGDGLLISAVDAGLLGSAVAVDEGTCLLIHHTSGRTHVLGAGVVRWFTRDPEGVVVRSERSPHKELPPVPAPPRFEGLARVAAAARAARGRQPAPSDPAGIASPTDGAAGSQERAE